MNPPAKGQSRRPHQPPAPLTSAQFHILLTLTQGQRHGYAIMKEVERDTRGATELGPGTLYRTIKQLVSRGLITEVEGPSVGEEPGRETPGKPRRVYALTPEGKAQALEETRRLRALARRAEEILMPEGGPS